MIGAVAGGATHIVAMKEPFGIASGALADLPVEAELEILDIGARVDPADTTRAALAMRDRGINVVITLGGDGTNRTIARVWPDVTLVPMSTGTNNVFPSLVEPTVAGAAAGLVATGKTDENEVAPKSKLIHLAMADGSEDVALIDAATLANDFVGNRMPVDPNNLRQLLVSTARPDTIGVSSVAGLHAVCLSRDDSAILVTCGEGGALTNAPIAPGLYQQVPVLEVQRIDLGEEVDLNGPSTLALTAIENIRFMRMHRLRPWFVATGREWLTSDAHLSWVLLRFCSSLNHYQDLVNTEIGHANTWHLAHMVRASNSGSASSCRIESGSSFRTRRWKLRSS